MAHPLTYTIAVLLVLTSLALSALYAVRVLRNSNDPLRWGLLGVLLSLGLTNLPAVVMYSTTPPTLPPLWIGWTARLVAIAMLVLVCWPLLRDTWREVCAWFRVGRDSWRFLKERR